MKINIGILCVLFFLLIVSANAEPLHVSLSTIPAVPTGKFIGQVTAADFESTMPNPCYKVTNCYLASFVISKDWLPEGQEGYTSWDTVNHVKRRALAFDAVTMGELLKNLRDANLLFISMTDYLPSSKGKNPTFCMFAGIYRTYARLIAGTRLSNCADAPPSNSTCTLKFPSIEFDWGQVAQSVNGYKELSKTISVSCTQSARIKLSISGAFIPLNGDTSKRAEFDFGEGWNGSLSKVITQIPEEAIEIKSRLAGMEEAVGEYSGSSILILEIL